MGKVVIRNDIIFKKENGYYSAMYNGILLFTADYIRECEQELHTLTDEELNALYNLHLK